MLTMFRNASLHTPETRSRRAHGAASRRINVGSNAIEWVKQMNDAVLAFMIEKKSAMDNLEEILSRQRRRYSSVRPQ